MGDRVFTGKPCKRGHIAERVLPKRDCVECLKLRQRTWEIKNRERNNARLLAWYHDNKEIHLARCKSWQSRNPDRVRKNVAAYQTANKEKLKTAADQWVKNNPEKRSAIRKRCRLKNWPREKAEAARRRAALIQSVPQWADFEKIRWFYEEATRLTQETGIQHHVDHIYPLQSKWMCGLHVHTNLQILVARDNLSKSNRVWPGSDFVLAT